jgi:hypothetical protein
VARAILSHPLPRVAVVHLEAKGDDVVEGRWECVEPAPAGPVPGPAGRWRGADGVPLHGTWIGQETERSATVVVANHGHVLIGWRAPRLRWRFTSDMVRTSNCALAQVPWVWQDRGRLVASDPSDVAVGLVLAGRKPVALADAADERVARRWERAATDAGLVARCVATRFDCGPTPVTRWFVTVAVPGTVAGRFDLDTLIGDYAACLPGAELTEVERALYAISTHEVADLAFHPDLIMPASAGEYARTGLVLGYHPATTASLILREPRFSWASESTVMVDGLAPLAAPAGLPGLPSSLRPEQEGVR